MRSHVRRIKQKRAFLDAVCTRDCSLVETLLNQGANVNQSEDEHGQTALMLAVQFGDGSMVRLLLDKGADIHARDESGKTALSFAPCTEKYTSELSEVFQMLLAGGADINAQDNEGESIMMKKIQEAAPAEAIQVLLERGADPTLKDDDGETALSIAERYGFLAIAGVLTKKHKS